MHTAFPINPDFLLDAASRKTPWGPLGEVVYKRTYSRWMDTESRRERWPETIKRVVEFSLGLDPVQSDDDKQVEAQELFSVLQKLEGFTSGRTLWMGGSPFSYDTDASISQWNCSSHSIKSTADLHDLVYLLMSGTGGGPRITADVVDAFNLNHVLSAVSTACDYEFYDYTGEDGSTDASILIRDYLHVGDSRKGWAVAVKLFVEEVICGNSVYINFDAVRPLGSRLKSFGGYASGHEPLLAGMQEIEKIVNAARAHGKLSDVDLLDMCCLIGRLVVAGGSRRSALMCLGDSEAFANCKTGEWYVTHPWRSQTNITVVKSRGTPERAELVADFDRLMQFGEPGLLNELAAKKRRADFNGVNPCAEILMQNYGVCNLVELNLMAFVEGGVLDVARALQVISLLTRHALRITNLEITGMLGNWNEVQKKDRLLGVGLTAIGDYLDAAQPTKDEFEQTLALLRSAAQQTAADYAEQMGIPCPLLTCTIKPSGSLSLLPGVSSGVHAAYAPYYLRRVRISGVDAVAKALKFMGVPCEPDVFNAGTEVFTFPVKTLATRQGADYSAVDQLSRYRSTMDFYTDHNTSVTVTVDPQEQGAVVDWLLENWDHYVGVSFLPKIGTSYPQMPFEAITEAQYHEHMVSMPNLGRFESYLEGMEASMSATDDLESCESGVCPVR